MGIDIEHDFKPMYEVSPEKKKVVSELDILQLGFTFYIEKTKKIVYNI